jgi:hypothetical protein
VGTFAVNMTGCFVAGLVIATLVDGHESPAWLRLGLVVGFLGAYTTFSAFAHDLYDLALASSSPGPVRTRWPASSSARSRLRSAALGRRSNR